jgi:hypothetical protein
MEKERESSTNNSKMDPMRQAALDRASMAMHLLDEKTFPRVNAAISTKNQQAFMDICTEKGIPISTGEAMWSALIANIDKKGSYWP